HVARNATDHARPAPDRRVRRTRHRLKEALLQLIEERSYDRITVADITDHADVGRSTFYSHFDSKEELLFDGFEAGLRALAAPGPAGGPGFRFSLPLLRHIGTQPRFALATLGRSANSAIQQTINRILSHLVRLELERTSPSPSAAREAEVHGIVGAFRGLVTWWLTSGSRMSPEALDQVFQRLVSGR
ncbi:MAG TPA: TetR/AcrR family transcriptional regulator, partial [Gemmatimonadales bacterium]